NGDIFVGEIIGTAILILFGAGVVAAVVLNYSKAKDAGWVVIALGWGFGVMAGAYPAAPLSGGHLNPAVTLGIAIDTGDWDQVHVYVAGQLVGAMLGAVLCWLVSTRSSGPTRRRTSPSRRSASSPRSPRSAIPSPTSSPRSSRPWAWCCRSWPSDSPRGSASRAPPS